MNNKVTCEINKLKRIFKEGFLNEHGEFVICHPYKGQRWTGSVWSVYCNVYFNAETCNNGRDVQRKVIEDWSRDAYKSTFGRPRLAKEIHKYIRDGINEYLGTEFDENDFRLIYTRLGGGINRALAEKFVKSGFDLEVLEKEELK